MLKNSLSAKPLQVLERVGYTESAKMRRRNLMQATLRAPPVKEINLKE